MKKFFLILILIGVQACQKIDYSVSPIEESNLSYPNAFINWHDLFNQDSKTYFVYVFAYDCYYCNETKTKIISFYNSCSYPVLFCEYLKQIPIQQNTQLTIGKATVEEVFIKGTPTLILINKGEVVINAAGKGEVCEIIDLYSKNQ